MVSLGILFYVTRWDYFMHNPLAPIIGGIEGVIARARRLQPLESEISLSSLLLLGQRGWILYVLPTRQVFWPLVGMTVLWIPYCHYCFHVPRRFLIADSGGQTQVAWCAYAPIILFLLLNTAQYVHLSTVGCRYVRYHFQHFYVPTEFWDWTQECWGIRLDSILF